MIAKLHEKEQARALRREGEPIKRIAKQLGVAPSSVHLWCADIELTKEQQQKIKERRRKRRERECRWCGRVIESHIKIDGRKTAIRRKRECLRCRPYQRQDKRPKRVGRKKTNGECVVDCRRKLKERAVAYKGGVCRICDYDKCVTSMTFHHLDPDEKDFHIASGDYRGWTRVKAELDKCVLLCTNCHGEVHEGVTELEPYLTKEEIELAYKHIEKEDNPDPTIFDFFDAGILWGA